MSLVINQLAHPAVVKAARELDLIEACKNHQLPSDPKKYRTLATVMREAGERFTQLVNTQGAFEPGEFFRIAYERAQLLKKERAALLLYRKQRREQDQASLAAMGVAA